MKRFFILLFLLSPVLLYAQPIATVVDGVAAVVGKNIVLISDVESKYHQYLQQGTPDLPELRCRILDQLLLNKLLLHQADIDSLVITEEQLMECVNIIALSVSQLA